MKVMILEELDMIYKDCNIKLSLVHPTQNIRDKNNVSILPNTFMTKIMFSFLKYSLYSSFFLKN